MNKIVILRGNCASGKSTTALELQKKLGRGSSMLIPQDVVRREMLWVKDAPGNQAIELMKHLVEYGNKNCKITILEGILYSNSYESLFKRIAELYGTNIHAYYFDVPFEETLVRQSQRPVHNAFGEKEMRKWWREKDYISFIPEKTIDAVAINTEQIVEMILKDIM